jgi:hypothetical protein
MTVCIEMMIALKGRSLTLNTLVIVITKILKNDIKIIFRDTVKERFN